MEERIVGPVVEVRTKSHVFAGVRAMCDSVTLSLASTYSAAFMSFAAGNLAWTSDA